MSERVLVIPTRRFHELGLFQGFCERVQDYLPGLLDSRELRYVPRAEAEHDPSLKQLIPYVVFRHEGRVFHYFRGGGGEKRLHAKRSIGVGGHICSEDGEAHEDAYQAGMARELAEEVCWDGLLRSRCIGMINDDSTPVGQVHLGIVHVYDLSAPRVESREAELIGGGFAELAQLRSDREAFETWSQFLLDGPWLERS